MSPRDLYELYPDETLRDRHQLGSWHAPEIIHPDPQGFYHTQIWGSGYDDVPAAFRPLIDAHEKSYDPSDGPRGIPYARYASKERGDGSYEWDLPQDPPRKERVIRQSHDEARRRALLEQEVAAQRLRAAMTRRALPEDSNFDRWKSERERYARGECELSVVLMFVNLEDADRYDSFWASDDMYQHGQHRSGPPPEEGVGARCHRRGLGWHRNRQDHAGTAHR